MRPATQNERAGEVEGVFRVAGSLDDKNCPDVFSTDLALG